MSSGLLRSAISGLRGPGNRFSDCRGVGNGTALMQVLLARATGLGKHVILGGIDPFP